MLCVTNKEVLVISEEVMRLLHRISNLSRNLFRKGRQEQDLNEEITAYLDLLIQRKIERGVDTKEARREALIEFGGTEQVKQKVREARMGQYIETLVQDT